MSDRPVPLQLLLIDPDPIFRLGLRVALETIPHLQVIADVPTDTAALQVLAEITASEQNQVNLIILELGNGIANESQQLGLQFCRQLKALYPNIPILLLSSISQSETLRTAKNIGVNGYCPKGTSISELVPIIEEITNGGCYWLETAGINSLTSHLPFAQFRNQIRVSGVDYINNNLTSVTSQLKLPGLPILDKAILAGQRRELLAARWLVDHLLVTSEERKPTPKSKNSPLTISSSNQTNTAISKTEPEQIAKVITPALTPKAIQSTLFTACINKLNFSLENITEIPLEIDILREDKKRELLYFILQQMSQILDEIRNFKPEIKNIKTLKNQTIKNLWESAVKDFYSKKSPIDINGEQLEIVSFLLNNADGVETEIINKIPLVEDLFSYLILQTDLYVDNKLQPAGSEIANSQAAMILENLLIQVANGVLQPLLNSLADVEIIKQNFYTRHLISTREIERFRNSLSWKYRLNNYVNEPQAIFESRYELFVFAPRGIAKVSIYSPRNQELAQLSGVPLVVTLILELRDAIAPQLQSLLSILGSGIVFVLTQIVGRGLGLIARGIIQGIGSVSFTDKPFRRNNK
jgi:DNA-binding NarL/FixJ family response regulator